jgi:Domain of unknown function (DUF4158)
MTDHSRALAAVFGMRLPTAADLPLMIEAAAQAAWSADRGQPIVAGTIAALRAEKILLPASAVIERAAIAGRARARKRAADALLDAISAEQIAKLDKLLTVDPAVGMTPFAWLKNIPTSPKADHIRELIDRLRFVRDIGLPSGASARLHDDRFQQFIREGHLSDAHQIERYAAHRRRALLVAVLVDLEARLTDAVLDMADKLIGAMFARAKRARERRYDALFKRVVFCFYFCGENFNIYANFRRYFLFYFQRNLTRLGQPDGISPSRMAEMLEVDRAGPKVRC